MMLDIPAIIWAAAMVLMFAGFILFTLWQRLKNHTDKSDELDLETYRKIKAREEWLASVRRKQEGAFEAGPGEAGSVPDSDTS